MSALTCILCESPFDTNSHLPNSLACGHSVCQHCTINAQFPLPCPLDGRNTIKATLSPSPYAGAFASAPKNSVLKAIAVEKSGLDAQLASLHLTFDSLQSQLEARKFVLSAEASSIATKDIQQREALLELCLRLQEAGETAESPGLKHLTEKVLALKRDKFRLSCIFDQVNANRFITAIGTQQPDVVRKQPFECDSFTNVTYWMLPPCCYRTYCCVKCHNDKEDHVWQYANRMICIFCGREQEYRKLPNQCQYCGYHHTGVRNKT